MPIPKLKTGDLNDELLAIQHRGHFIDAASVEYRQIEFRLLKQIKDDPVSGYGLYATLCGLAGDTAGMRDNFKKALNLTADPRERANYAIALCNLGYFSEAALHLPIMERPENGVLSDAINVSLEVGRIAGASRLIGKWNELHVDEPKDAGSLRAAAALLEKAAISDDGLLPGLDIVGAVMRARGLIFIGEPSVALIQSGDTEQISFRFSVAVEPEKCALLNCNLVDSLFASGVPLYEHVVHFGFDAVDNEVQRLAA